MSTTPATPPTPAASTAPRAHDSRYDTLRMLLRSPTFIVGAGIVLWWIVCAVAGTWIAPLDPYASDPLNSLTPPAHGHWFGTDQLGRDVLSRVIVGRSALRSTCRQITMCGGSPLRIAVRV